MMSHEIFTLKSRFAFTMIELVFVIVLMGILASLALPRMERDLRQEAGDNILSAIRYTQHLALNDNKHNNNNEADWQKRLWQIGFFENNRYAIWSNADKGGSHAFDPHTGKALYSSDNQQDAGESSDIFLGKKYGINNISLSGCSNIAATTGTNIAFDNFGRPFRDIAGATNNYDRYVVNTCQITFTSSEFTQSLVIEITPETGYAFIVDQNGS